MTSEGRKRVVQSTVVFVGLLFVVRLLYIQVFDPVYKREGEDNIKLKMIDYPYRGLVTDRNGKQLVVNEPVFDLMVVPREVKSLDTLAFCDLLGIEREELTKRLRKARKYSRRKASPVVRGISRREFSQIESALIDYPGFYVRPQTQRSYPNPISGLLLGYVGEISDRALKRDTSGYYRRGDMWGREGLERYYERSLRGQRGVRYKIKNAYGVVKGSFANGNYDTLSVEGKSLQTTIDLELQQYVEELIRDKRASFVAIEPATGEILSFVSAPTYEPTLLTGKQMGRNYAKLLKNDSTLPLFNRPITATYPPGSTFKAIQSLMAMQEGVVGPREKIYCDNSLIRGHAPEGKYDFIKGLQYSSNDFFARVFKRVVQQGKLKNPFKDAALGIEVWAEYVRRFGLGNRTGVDLYGEKKGNVPNKAYYDRWLGRGKPNRWKASTIRSISIGQGELLVTPIQLANVGAIMANRGFYIQPHLVKSIGDEGVPEKYRQRHSTGIDKEYYNIVVQGMRKAVGTTAFRAEHPGLDICGKTGTAQNPHGEDHSIFMAFAPMDNPKIAVAAYVENSGFGGRAAASLASLAIEKYLKKTVSRPYLERYVRDAEYLKQLGSH